MNNLKELKEKLQVVKLEERLEMIQLIPSESTLSGDNGCCTGNDDNCNPPPKDKVVTK
jgi:hypothetical protein